MKSFLTGLATGLAIGYLTAPRSGKETRDQLTETANKQTKGLKEQWDKTKTQVTKLVEDAKTGSGLFQSEPNLFADMEAGKLDKFKDDAQRTKGKAKSQYNDRVDDTANAAKAGVTRAEEALKL